MIRRPTRRSFVVLAAGAVGLAAVGVGATWPVSTKQGVNYDVTSHRIPLYLKALEFVDRSAHYEGLADAILARAQTDEDRALTMLAWTMRNVRDVPEGFPVVDDHIDNIIIRGYGTDDQQADVFATLLTYGGVPAFWQTLRAPDGMHGLIFTFARIGDRWRVFDVAAGVAFRAAGDLAVWDDLRADPAIVPDALRATDVGGISYGELLPHLAAPVVPVPLRAELQMPARRLWHEAKRSAGFGHDDVGGSAP